MKDNTDDGSRNIDDDGRPRWDARTKLKRGQDYHNADGSYAYTTEKGVNSEGEDCWRTIRNNLLPFGDRLEPGDRVDYWPGKGDGPWVLYRLPELIEATKAPGALVVVCEGEKDVDTARALGFTATTNPCGALKWLDEFSPYLAGCRVAIIPDNDVRGRQHADKVARSVAGVAQSVVVVELPGLPVKGDLSDWVEKRKADGETIEAIAVALQQLIEHAPPPAKRKAPVANVDNIARVIEEDPAWRGVVAYDEFGDNIMLLKPVPGTSVPKASFQPRPWTDTDDVNALRWFNRHDFPGAAKATVADAVAAVAADAVISPVRHYLEGLTWDGVPRLSGWLATYCGADVADEEGESPGAKAEFVAELGRRWMIGAVARALEPGCKVDNCLVMEGEQGIGKSTALRVLADGAGQPKGCRSWFNDSVQAFVGKDSQSLLRGSWIVELGELAAMRRAEIEHVKSYLSRQEDRYRPAYGRREVEMPRRCVFAGTTNRTDYLRDETGNRRFWPVAVGKIDIARLAEDRDQLWAEAVAAFRAGEPWHLTGKAAHYQTAEVNKRTEEDPWAWVVGWLSDVKEVSPAGVLRLLGLRPEDHGKNDSARVGGMLARAGWVKRGRFKGRGMNRDLAMWVNPAAGAVGALDEARLAELRGAIVKSTHDADRAGAEGEEM